MSLCPALGLTDCLTCLVVERHDHRVGHFRRLDAVDVQVEHVEDVLVRHGRNHLPSPSYGCDGGHGGGGDDDDGHGGGGGNDDDDDDDDDD